MKRVYKHSERIFEKITSLVVAVLGNSITFILALVMVMYFLFNKQFFMEELQEQIRDIMSALIFVSLFIIQKSFNRFSAALHLKVNELVVSHDAASNAVINVEEKTEYEIIQLTKEYSELIDQVKEEEIEKLS